jgi:hypothetical protein
MHAKLCTPVSHPALVDYCYAYLMFLRSVRHEVRYICRQKSFTTSVIYFASVTLF